MLWLSLAMDDRQEEIRETVIAVQCCARALDRLETVMFTMPSQMGLVRPISRVCREEDPSICLERQEECVRTGFIKSFHIYKNTIVVVQ